MVSNLANYLNNPPKYTGVLTVVVLLGAAIAIGFICLLIKNKYIGNLGLSLGLLGIVAGVTIVLLSSEITYELEKTNLQTELDSKMETIDKKYPYQLSIADSNNNVYFVLCKTKNSQNKVIKTMNIENNPTIKFSNRGHVATYINLPYQIHNGAYAERKVDEKVLLEIVKINFENC